MKILIVDDNQDAAESIEELITPLGHSATVILRGQEAVNAYRRSPYDLVFMDLKMPDIDGLETSRRILGWDPKARIVVITGNSIKEDLDQVSRVGCIGLLRKPFKVEDLLSYLK